jgi:hypothetical protein
MEDFPTVPLPKTITLNDFYRASVIYKLIKTKQYGSVRGLNVTVGSDFCS